jgi:signal transduction histidine kinase
VLYSVALGIKTGRVWLDRDPQRAAEPLDFALAQAEIGLAEMRALIFELRPEALEKEGLVAALERQTALLQARNRISVQADFGDEPNVPLPIKETLYRVAQEALHNIAKHAEASDVQVCLSHAADYIALEIRDNGKGFDSTGSFPGHLGLQSMRERAAGLGGSLDVESAAGAGTRVRAHVPCPPGKE